MAALTSDEKSKFGFSTPKNKSAYEVSQEKMSLGEKISSLRKLLEISEVGV